MSNSSFVLVSCYYEQYSTRSTKIKFKGLRKQAEAGHSERPTEIRVDYVPGTVRKTLSTSIRFLPNGQTDCMKNRIES
jgi:hypothetical protein